LSGAVLAAGHVAIAAEAAGGIWDALRAGGLQMFGQGREEADDVAEAFLLVWFGHADDCAERVGVGIVAGIGRARGKYDGNVAQAGAGFHVRAEIETGEQIRFAFNFGDDHRGHEHIENFAGVVGVIDGDHFVAFVLQKYFHGVAQHAV